MAVHHKVIDDLLKQFSELNEGLESLEKAEVKGRKPYKPPKDSVPLEDLLYEIMDKGDAALLEKGFPEYRDDQPRDDQGRWSGGGGSNGGAFNDGLRVGREAADLYARSTKNGVPTPEEFISRLPRAQQDYITRNESRLRSSVRTDEDVSKGGFKFNDRWLPERAAIHEQIIKDYINDAAERARPDEGEKPVLVMMGGRAGSGKTTALFESGLVNDMDRYLYLNADDIKDRLPGYEGWNAGAFHEESGIVTERIERAARDLGLNVLYDATMRSAESARQRVDDFLDAGYDVVGLYVHATPEIATGRTITRGMGSGRYIPPVYVLSSTTNEKAFDAVKGSMSSWYIYDNNGNKPRLVASGSKRVRLKSRRVINA